MGTSVAVSKFELGANSEAVPMSGLSGPGLPTNRRSGARGCRGKRRHRDHRHRRQIRRVDLDIYGDTGIDCSGNNCNDGNSNSEFNGNNLTTSNGINQIVNLAGVTEEINAARNPTTGISSLLGSQTLTFTDGIWDSDLTILLAVGVTVFDFDTNGNDLKLEGANLLIDGPRVPTRSSEFQDEANFLVSNSNLVVGDAGIGMNNVLFYTDKPDDNQHINVNSSIVTALHSGISGFWRRDPLRQCPGLHPGRRRQDQLQQRATEQLRGLLGGHSGTGHRGAVVPRPRRLGDNEKVCE